MGGLLIWSMVADKNDDGVDCAVDLKPIAQIEKLKNEVERAISQALMPCHEGIQIWPILVGKGPVAGLSRRSNRSKLPGQCK